MSYARLTGFGGAQAPARPELPGIPGLVPTKAAVKEDLGPYIDIANNLAPPPGFDPTDPDTWKPELVIPYGVRMMGELQKELGLAPVDLQQTLGIVKGDIKWLDEMGIPLTSIPTNLREACIAYARCAAVVACKQLGVPPEIGTVTVDALSDGEFTDKDVEAIGSVAGGVAGSTICGLIGIPPQLGGYFGSFAGNVLGGLVSDALDIGGGSAEREERNKQMRAARAAVRKQLNQIRGQYQSLVIPLVRSLYWEVFDRQIADLENFWEGMECLTGVPPKTGTILAPVRFPLLWGASGMLQNLGPREAPLLRYAFDAPRCPPPRYDLTRDETLCVSSALIAPGTASGCPSMFGCPYPKFPPLGAGGGERVAQAFAAYNHWWMQPQNRAANTEAWKAALPEPPARIVNFIARRTEERQGCKSDACRHYADRDIGNAVEQYNALLGSAVELAGPDPILASGMRIQADIVSSASVYSAASALRVERNAIRSGNTTRIKAIMGRIGDPKHIQALQRKIALAKVTGPVLNGLLNFGLPALGAVLLGAAVLRRR